MLNHCDGTGANFCNDEVLVDVYIEHKFEVGSIKGLQIPVRFSNKSNPDQEDLDYITGKQDYTDSGFINTIGVGLHWEF